MLDEHYTIYIRVEWVFSTGFYRGFFSIIINKFIFITIINILILNCQLYNFIYLNNLQS